MDVNGGRFGPAEPSAETAPSEQASRRVRRLAIERVLRGLARGALWTGLVGGFVFAAGLTIFVGELARYEKHEVTRADAIVVLTGGADRINDGVRLLREGTGRRLLISGLNGRTTPEELARREPALRPMLDCCVDFGYRARNTLGNAEETRLWRAERGFRTLAVVTSTYHMPRTMAEFGHAMPGAALVPYPVVSDQIDLDRWWRNPLTIRLLATEYVKYLVATARIRLERGAGAAASGAIETVPPTFAFGR